jgi:16S rRNA (cytosine967-C5)-methyltransferase
LRLQLQQAREMAHTFATNPRAFAPDDLRAKAIPSWVADQVEVTDGWLRVLQTEPDLWVRARPGTASRIARRLGFARCAVLPDALRYEGEADLFKTPEFQAGEFEIQDLASQAVGWLCAPAAGAVWWDACAGEGGKTLHLSDLMQNRGLIWATDRAAWRLARLKRRAARARVFNYRSALWNGGANRPTKTSFDGVLVDAPCSGLGTWQRNPHARWTTTPADIQELALVQSRLLANAAPAVKPGGKLIYSVCTLTRAETIAVVEHFNATQPDFSPDALPLAALAIESNRGFADAARVFLRPESFGGNGMFVAAWRRSL